MLTDEEHDGIDLGLPFSFFYNEKFICKFSELIYTWFWNV